jgi:hypothetical protein
VNFSIPKLIKIRWSSLFFGSFAPHFQIELITYGSNLNSIFVIMSELKFSMGKTNFFHSTLPFSPWAVLATWLHVGAPQKIQEN